MKTVRGPKSNGFHRRRTPLPGNVFVPFIHTSIRRVFRFWKHTRRPNVKANVWCRNYDLINIQNHRYINCTILWITINLLKIILYLKFILKVLTISPPFFSKSPFSLTSPFFSELTSSVFNFLVEGSSSCASRSKNKEEIWKYCKIFQYHTFFLWRLIFCRICKVQWAKKIEE